MAKNPFEGVVIPKLTPAAVKKALEKGQKRAQELLDRFENRIPPKSRVGKCVVCGGRISERYELKYNPAAGPMVFGPGSRQQHHWASNGLGCEDCGLSYKKLPTKECSRRLSRISDEEGRDNEESGESS